MLFVRRRQNVCRRERKIIKAHYMLAYKCGLRRLRSRPRRPIRHSGRNKEHRGQRCLSGFIYNYKSSAVVFDYLKKMFSLFSFCFLYFCLLPMDNSVKKTRKKTVNICIHAKKAVPLQTFSFVRTLRRTNWVCI